MKPAIVVVAFNRPKSLYNLLTTISLAHFHEINIPLIISIDFIDSIEHEEVIVIANAFKWKYGEKKIIQHTKNIGLKNHILLCGDLALDYGAVIILEDDLRVSPGFYTYASTAA